MSAVNRGRGTVVGLVALALVGCPGDKPGTSTEGTGGTSTSTTAEGSSTGTTLGASGQTTAEPTSGSGEASTGSSGACEAAMSREACAAATPSSDTSVCSWVEFFAVSTAGMMCMAQTKMTGCFEVPVNDGGCGVCHYKQVGPDMFEVAVLDAPLNCNEFMAGEFQSCDADPDVQVFACACGCE